MTTPSTGPAIPAGWYPDPGDTQRQRWWDGSQWTAHTAPLTAAAPSGPSTPAQPGAPGQGYSGSPHAPSLAGPAARGRRWSRWWLLAGLGGVVLLVGVFGSILLTRRNPYPSEWDARVAPIAAFVAQERGLDYTHPVEVVLVPDGQFSDSVSIDVADLDDDARQEVSTSESQLRAFGLIDGSVDLVDSTSELRSSGILAYYSPEDEKVFVRGTDITPAVEATLAHELVHVLQDQHFDLRQIEQSSPDPGAVRAIVEGDATRIRNAYVAQLPPARQEAVEDQEVDDLVDADFDSQPDALVAATAAPYLLGEPAVGVLAARGGNPEVNQVFLRPPSADVQILDPGRLFDTLPEPPTRPVLPDGAEVVSADETLGATFWDIVLARRVGLHPALDFADTWAGDVSVTYTTVAGRTCTASAIQATDAEAAEAMLAVLQAWLAAGSQPLDDETFARPAANATTGPAIELGVCDPGPESVAPGANNAQEAVTLAAVRLEIEAQALQGDQSLTVARCLGHAAVAGLDVDDLGASADPEVVRAKVTTHLQAAIPVCDAGPS